MRTTAILPYASALLVAQAVLGAAAGIVAAREGGMGLGSALIIGQIVQLATLAAGAVFAAYIVQRWSPAGALVAGAVLCYAGLLAIGTAPMGALAWLIAAFAVGGVGLGLVSTAAFAAAAGIDPRSRPVAVLGLVSAVLAARAVAPLVASLESLAFPLAGVSIVAIAVGAKLRDHGDPIELGAASRGRIIGAAVLIGAGTLGVVSAIDPSRLSATAIASLFGAGSIEALDATCLALLLGGLVLLVAGTVSLLGGSAVDRVALGNVAALALGTFAAFGVASGMFLSTAALRLGGDVGVDPSTAALAATAVAIVVAGWWVRRGGDRRRVGTWGAGAISLATLLAVALAPANGSVPASTAGPALAAAVSGIGLGMLWVALRLLLAEVPPMQRAVAAAGGVVGAAVGALAGGMAGTWFARPLFDPPASGIAVGALGLTAVAVVATVMLAVLDLRDRRVARTR